MESSVQDPAAALAAAPAAKAALKMTIMVVLGGLLVGGAVGMFAAGPAIAAKLSGEPAAADAKKAPAKDEHGKEVAEGGTRVLRIIDNLVLNPANSGGTRFLMVTATFEVKDAAADELLKARDAEVRDALLTYFGKQTVEDLTDMTRRAGIKSDLLAVFKTMFPVGTVKAVYFPQFVIQ